MDKIEIDFSKALKQADELDAIANRIRRISQNNINTTLHNISQNWQSDNSGSFYMKGTQLAGNITETANQLSMIAQNIRNIARRTYEAEKRAQEIAMKRNY